MCEECRNYVSPEEPVSKPDRNPPIGPDEEPVPDFIWARIVNGRVIETFTNHQSMNASDDQEHIHGFKREE